MNTTPHCPLRWSHLSLLALTLLLVVGSCGHWLHAGTAGLHPELDLRLLSLLAAARTPALDRLFAAVTWLGSLLLIAPATLLFLFHLRARGKVREAAFLGLSVAGIIVLSHAAKLWVARPRPGMFEVIGQTPLDLSFPSAHAAQAMAFWLAVAVLAARRRPAAAPLFVALSLVVTTAVAGSRLYLQVHFPSDVLAGALLALGWVGGLSALVLGARPQDPNRFKQTRNSDGRHRT